MTTTGTHTANSQYAGDVTPQQAWEMLQDQAGAVLVDVRTNAEWAYVGSRICIQLVKNVN